LGKVNVHGLAGAQGAAEQVAELALVVQTLAAGDERAGSYASGH